MLGLDDSDLIAFMRVIDAPPSDIAVRAAGIIETVQHKIKGYEAHIAAKPEDRLLYERPIKRCEELLVRLKSADPWAYWPFAPDEYLHGIAAWAGHGYWQGSLRMRTADFLWSNANGMAVALRQALQHSGSTACGKNARSGQWLIGGMTSVAIFWEASSRALP
jgi:hypothetical protein